jgi:hypothetical protein
MAQKRNVWGVMDHKETVEAIFEKYRGFKPDEFTYKDKQYGAELRLIHSSVGIGRTQALEDLKARFPKEKEIQILATDEKDPRYAMGFFQACDWIKQKLFGDETK